MADYAAMKLGRIRSREDQRTLKLADFTTAALPTPPPACLWQTPVTDWGMMGNDNHGNCVIVTAAHLLLSMRANKAKDTRRITDAAVIELSREMGALDGYQIIDRLKWWRRSSMWGDHLWAFALLATRAPETVKTCIHQLGGADIGLALPLAWQNEDPWSTGNDARHRPGSWGLHSVPLVGYTDELVYCVTWGRIQAITWPALATYCDEAYALIDPNWIEGDGIAPSGFDLNALHAALRVVGADALQLPRVFNAA